MLAVLEISGWEEYGFIGLIMGATFGITFFSLRALQQKDKEHADTTAQFLSLVQSKDESAKEERTEMRDQTAHFARVTDKLSGSIDSLNESIRARAMEQTNK